MFQKDHSSVSFKGKKFQDVPLRKSERRQLRQRAAATLRLPDADAAEAESSPAAPTSSGCPPAGPPPSHSSDAAAAAHAVLDDAFLRGTLTRRTATRSDGGKVRLYFRSGVASEAEATNDSSCWPYDATAQCVWIEEDDSAGVPSVALLSTFPPNSVFLPTVVIAAAASRYICRGADVMRAGVMRVARMGDSRSSAVVPASVAVAGNPQPFAVGWLRMTDDFWTNRRGVAVRVASTYGDDLWRQQFQSAAVAQQQSAASSRTPAKGNQNHRPSDRISPWGGAPYSAGHHGNLGFLDGARVLALVGNGLDGTKGSSDDEDDGDDVLEDAVPGDSEDATIDAPGLRDETAATNDRPESSPDQGDTSVRTSTESVDDADPELVPPLAPVPPAAPEQERTPDEVLHRAVCRALVRLSHKSDFPLSSATFYAAYVLPHRDPGSTVNLKQTSWKKFSSYLQCQVERGLLTVEADPAKKDPAAKLTGFDRRHADLRELLEAKRAAAEGLPDDDGGMAAPRKTVLVDLYAIPKPMAVLMRLDDDAVSAATATSDERRGTGLLNLQEARRILDDYVSRESLVLPARPDQVALDGPLTEVLYPRRKHAAEPAPPPESLTRKELVAAWLSRLDRGYALVELPGSRIARMGRGSPPTIILEVSRRRSNKFVTAIKGLPGFNIDPHAFAKDVATRFACSTTVEQGEFGSATQKAAATVVLVQGHVTKELEALLTGDDRMSDHGGIKDSPYRVPKGVVIVQLMKGVPPKKNKK